MLRRGRRSAAREEVRAGWDALESVAPAWAGLGFAGAAGAWSATTYVRWQFAVAALVTKHVGRTVRDVGPGLTAVQVGGDRRALAYYPRGVDRLVAVLGASASDAQAELTARLARENGVELRAVKTCADLEGMRDVGAVVCVGSGGEAARGLATLAACLGPGSRLVFAETGDAGDQLMDSLEEAVREGLFAEVEVDGQWLNGFPVRAAVGAAVRTAQPAARVGGAGTATGGAEGAPVRPGGVRWQGGKAGGGGAGFK